MLLRLKSLWAPSAQVQVDQIQVNRSIEGVTHQPCYFCADESRVDFDELWALIGHHEFNVCGPDVKTHSVQDRENIRLQGLPAGIVGPKATALDGKGRRREHELFIHAQQGVLAIDGEGVAAQKVTLHVALHHQSIVGLDPQTIVGMAWQDVFKRADPGLEVLFIFKHNDVL